MNKPTKPLAAKPGQPGMDLDDDAGDDLDQQVQTKESPAPAQPDVGPDSRPFCAVHHCLMKAVGSTEKITRYACPVPDCKHTEKRARKQSLIPREPQKCPDRRCQGHNSYLEVDRKYQSTGILLLVCPRCGYSLRQPRGMPGRSRPDPGDDDLSAR